MAPGQQECNGDYIRRSHCNHVNLCEAFTIKEKTFADQYYPFYLARLSTMKDSVRAMVKDVWGKETKIVPINQLVDLENQRVVIIGILFKHMQLQPTILKEISEDNQLIPQPLRDRYTDEGDYMVLQDERECVKILGNLACHSHVTGIVVGLLGYASEEGNEFTVEEYCYSKLPEPIERLPLVEDKYVLILSGFGFSTHPSYEACSAKNMLIDFILGLIGPPETQISAKIVRIIVAGNCISKKVRQQEEMEEKKARVTWGKKNKAHTVEVMKIVDEFFSGLARSIDIDLMPGAADVTSLLLPQQPLHPSLLPKSSISTGIKAVTNPYLASFDNVLFLGSSGQNIQNIREFSEMDDPIEIMEKTIYWGHLAPTAPDTLQSYPHPNKDPFIIQKLPHVYFVGNQSKFATKYKKIGGEHSIRFISVPSFEDTFSGALLNLKDLSCDMISFR